MGVPTDKFKKLTPCQTSSDATDKTQPLITASQLVRFSLCQHITTLELNGTPKDEQTALSRLIAAKGDNFEKNLVNALKPDIKIPRKGKSKHEQAELTIAAMKEGNKLIHAAYFYDEELGLEGEADLLQRIDDTQNEWGYSYEVIDIKSSKKLKPDYLIQLCHYSTILTKIQGFQPHNAYVIDREKKKHRFKLSEYLSYYNIVLENYRLFLQMRPKTAPYPINHCSQCAFERHCATQLRQQDHISLTFAIRRSQVNALGKFGIHTVTQLASTRPPLPKKMRGIGDVGLERLSRQAMAQTGKIPIIFDHNLLSKLPDPKPGDLYFDIESYPFMEERRLEYLFGFIEHKKSNKHNTNQFWAKTLEEEATAFKLALEFLINHLKSHPEAHIYHYGAYEPSAIRRLSQYHAVYSDSVENLLREKFINLYSIISSSVAMPAESLSLKYIESLYDFNRHAGAENAVDSMVLFDAFLATDDATHLETIGQYNEDDLRSTMALHKWFCSLSQEIL